MITKNNMSFESNISELNGYLKSLQRLCGGSYSFGSRHFSAEEDINEFVNKLLIKWNENENYIYEGVSSIDFSTLKTQIENFVFNGILDRDNMRDDGSRPYATKLVIEDINEYYGLAATSLNLDVFHPLITGPVYKLNIVNQRYDSALYYLVKIGEYFVLTYFRHISKLGNIPE